MFVYHFVQVNEPFARIEPRVIDTIPGFAAWATEAYREGEDLRVKVGPGAHLAKEVLLHVIGDPVRGPKETWIPISWHATGLAVLFPRMEADIVVAAVGPELTQIALRGSYIVPMGAVGRVLDGVLLHRIAEASVKAFVDRIADAVRSPAVVGDAVS